MAKVVSPLMSVEARGKVAGIIYNTWRGLNTVKAFASPANPQTAAQLQARGYLQTYTSLWAGLTAVQRTSWTEYSSAHLLTDWTGKTKRLTGQNWYIGCNCRIARCGAAAITDPPAAAAPGAPTAVVASYTAGPPKLLKVTWTTPSSATVFVFIYVTGPHSAGRNPEINTASISAAIASNTAHPYTLITGATVGRYTCWVVAVDSVTGLASQPVSSAIDVTA